MSQKGTLTFFCGKMGAGKSTMARKTASQTGALLISEDQWLAGLYKDDIQNFADYLEYSSRLKAMLHTHIQDILNAGISIVLDFPGNTERQRAWFKDIFSAQAIPHKLIYLQASDELCLSQIARRRQTQPERARFDTEEVFHEVNQHFQPPSENEGFHVERVSKETE